MYNKTKQYNNKPDAKQINKVQQINKQKQEVNKRNKTVS